MRKYGSPVKASEKEEVDNLDAEQDEAPVQQKDSNSALENKNMSNDEKRRKEVQIHKVERKGLENGKREGMLERREGRK